MAKLIYKDKEIHSIGFYGLGRSSLGMLGYLRSRYEDIRFTLRADKPSQIDERTAELFSKILFSEDASSNFYEDIIFFSPSVRRERFLSVPCSAVFSSDAEFFTESTKSDVFVITGSDGKSTTVTLCAKILKALYSDAFAIGNIGEAMTPYLEKGENTAAVCELSSFQLSYFSPAVKRALITNITPNHLDWHTSFSEYCAAKENIYKRAEGAVLNADCPVSSELIKRHNNLFAVYSAKENISQIKNKHKCEHYIYIENETLYHNGEALLPIERISCRGRHNVYNFLAAAALCCDMPIKDALCDVADSFHGLAHRCCTVAKRGGIEFIDSSIDSSPKRTETTLASLTVRPIIILGGKSKGLAFDELIPVLKKKAKAVFLTGETGVIIEKLLAAQNFPHPFFYYADFDDAVIAAARFAQSGDTVILSPASTSFDRFSSFEERGERFKNVINDFLNKF